ncbi:DeoR/GlpR family DNA-binding transcription regulator [Neogemmobacter tilapiae]|uniref:DeoR/GlpR family transcriptional regulator n=1 Tax=Neogemmobacter tilapiae TaxID=875041 RepID=A0A918TUT0_9RHOB|nr:DeoR/GlpR family DNA-binding transcription regulator [Gemmobacter tilapiae]GHC60990.1 DeoR/GlpR family transcriptional regulator [Gemmobacter tilapiae]
MSEPRREGQLLALLKPAGEARVQDLARAMNVTEETIRRTIRRLEGQGLVTKVHGAVHLRDSGHEAAFAVRMGVNPTAKRRIAARLAGMLENGASLFLDVGTTTTYVAQALRDHHDLMVVTNSLMVAQALAMRNGNRVFVAGGEIRAHDGGVFGAQALAFVGQFKVKHAVLTAEAVDARSGFMLQDMREAEFSRAIIASAEEAVMVVDATKFGQSAPIRICEPGAIRRLVTDAPPPGDVGAMLEAAGVELTLA